MKIHPPKLSAFTAALLVLPLLLFAMACDEIVSDDPIEEHDDSFTLSGVATIDVDTFNGKIEVTGSDTDTVNIHARITRADKVDYEARQFGSSVQVSANQNSSTTINSPTADITITGPSSAMLVLRGSNGSITINNFEAGATLRTSNGRITVEGLSGDLEANTSNGTITVSGHSGSVDLSSSNGGINYSGTLVPGSDNDMTTSNGSITIELKGEPSVVLNASTNNGSVTSSLPVTIDRSGDSYLEGTIGSGAASLTAKTSNGSIRVK